MHHDQDPDSAAEHHADATAVLRYTHEAGYVAHAQARLDTAEAALRERFAARGITSASDGIFHVAITRNNKIVHRIERT